MQLLLTNLMVALSLGEPPPSADVKMKNVDGSAVSIADSKGERGTLVIFTCNHCPYSQAWESRIARLGNSAKKRGIGVIAVNPNDPKREPEDSFAEMKARTTGFEFPYVVDEGSRVARAFGATRTPEVFLFDAKGGLVYHGAVDDNSRDASAAKEKWLEQALDAVVAGRAPAARQTKAVGCSIKFPDA